MLQPRKNNFKELVRSKETVESAYYSIKYDLFYGTFKDTRRLAGNIVKIRSANTKFDFFL